MTPFLTLLFHDLRFHARRMPEWAALILFFIIVIILMPFAVGPDPELLRRLAPGFLWIAALLMSLLALEKLIVEDGRDGTLDLMLLSPAPLPAIIFAKLAAQSVAMLIALSAAAIPAALTLNMPFPVFLILLMGFALGIPVLVSLGGIMGAITITANRNPALLTILLAPFYIPVLIFAVAACDAQALGIAASTPLMLLGAIASLVLPTAPFIIAAALSRTQG